MTLIDKVITRWANKYLNGGFQSWNRQTVIMRCEIEKQKALKKSKNDFKAQTKNKIDHLNVIPLSLCAESKEQELDVMEAELRAFETEKILRRMEETSAVNIIDSKSDEPLNLRAAIERVEREMKESVNGDSIVIAESSTTMSMDIHIFSDSDSDDDGDIDDVDVDGIKSHVERQVVTIEQKIRRQSVEK